MSSGQEAVAVPFGWERNQRSGIALAMHKNLMGSMASQRDKSTLPMGAWHPFYCITITKTTQFMHQKMTQYGRA